MRERLQTTLFESPRTSAAATLPARDPISISELTDRMSRQLALGFSSVCVMGEISQVRRVASGHTYFTLKDSGATLDAMVWADRLEGLAVEPKQGMRVVAVGAIRVFAPSGRYSLHVDVLEAVGAGDLQRALEALKARLLAEGLFADTRKRPLPTILRTVGVVTSATGAVRHDIERTLSRGGARLRVVLSPSRVQGEGAALEIATAIGLLAERADIDVIIVARGGGSAEELWPFNDEGVARVIAASRPPVISAVGHEVDFTIADLVADVRASTPSLAAALLVDIQRRALERVDAASRALHRVMDQRRDQWRRRLDAVSTHRVMERERTKLERLRSRLGAAFARMQGAVDRRHAIRVAQFRDLTTRCEAQAPRQTFDRAHARVDRAVRAMGVLMTAHIARKKTRANRAFDSRGLRDAQARLVRVSQRFNTGLRRLTESVRPAVDRRASDFRNLTSQLDALSPLAVLSRGYALATTVEGRILLAAKDVEVGQNVVVRWSDGRVEATVTKRDEEA
ncbi:MAG: exodeoxyribonuclease VII large subunit [Vicinamibacteria bacterium]